MALIHSGYFNGVDAAEPILPPDSYNTGYQLAFDYDTYLEGSSGNTVLRIVRVYLYSKLMWYPLNLLGTAQYTGDVASLGIGFNTASVTRQITSGATGKYWAYDADQNEVSNQNPSGGWDEAVTFAYDEIDYPVVYKPHAPTTVLSAGASDKAVSVNVYIEIRDGEIGYLYKGNKAISVTVPRNQWVVKLHPNGGVVDGSSAATVTKTKYYNQTLTIPTPTKTNSVFKGWYTNAQGTGNPVSASYTQNADLELWAIWYEPYAVTYVATDSNVTNMPSPNPDAKVWNQNYTISSTKPVRSGGYVFKEWNTLSDGTGTPYAPGASYSTNAALTLYAIWYPPYGIAYNGNGGSDTASAVSNVPSMQIKSHGVALTLSSQKPTRPGYSFAHWNTNSSGSGTSYNPGDTYPASNNANQVLYAIWTPTVDSKAVTVNKSVRTGSLSSETEADEGEYAFIDFSYSFVGAASGTVSVSVGRTPEGGTRTVVPAARISGDTAKSKSVGYGTLSGNVKVHDDGGGSLPTTTRYKYDITVTFAGTSATGASYIEKAFFTVSFLGDDVPGQTPGHGVAFGMPATREAFEVGPSMPGHFWAALYAHHELIANGVRARSTPSYMVSEAGWYRVGKLNWSSALSSSGGAHTGLYPNCFLLIGGIYASARNTSAIFSVNVINTEVTLTQIGKATVGWLTKVRLVYVPNSNGEYYVDVYLTRAQNSFTISALGHASFVPNASLESVAEISDNPGVTIIGDALAPTGGTVTGMILSDTANNVAINFRNNASYSTTASYQTAGNEALVFASKQSVTSFIFVNGEDSIQNHNSDRWYSIAPGLQIKNNCVSIGELIPNGTTPAYRLKVNGVIASTDNYHIFSPSFDLKQADNGVSSTKWMGYDVYDKNQYGAIGLYTEIRTNGKVGGGIWVYNRNTSGTQVGSGRILTLVDKSGNVSYEVSSYPAFRNAINAIGGESADGYYGMVLPGGGTSDWFRTTVNGIIPYSSDGTNGKSGLGTSSWPFSYVYAKNFYGYFNGNVSGSASSATTASYANFPNVTSGNEIRFNKNGNSPTTLWFGWAWSDTSTSPKLTQYSFGDCAHGYANIQAAKGIFSSISFRAAINSNTGNGNITLTSSAANYNHMRIYYYTNESYYDSMDVYSPNGKTITITAARGENGSPNKFWVKTKVMTISGTTISSGKYAEYGANSSNTWGVNANNYIYISRVEVWNE